jgi:predicted metal-dependent peptidase
MSFDNKDLEKIRAKVVADYPLLSSFMFNLEMKSNEFIPTLKVNMKEVVYNPEYMASLSPVDQMVSFIHEIAHVFLGHPLRIRPVHDKEKIQRAADYAVNDLLKDMGLPIPYTFLWSHEFTGMAMEEIYAKLEDNQERRPQPKWNENEQGECMPDSQPSEGREGEQDTPEQREKKLEEHAQKQMEAIQQARMMGDMPANLRRRLDKMTESKTDWRQLLPPTIEDVLGMEDYTFEHPDRRYDCEFILPGMVGTKVGSVVFAADTSGSISKKQLVAMASEVMSCVQNIAPEKTYVIWCDSKIGSVQVFNEGEEPGLKPVGGGGTDFRPPFKYVHDNNIDPIMLIYLTDGYCSSFAKKPDYPVIWLVWQDQSQFRPPYGRVIVM